MKRDNFSSLMVLNAYNFLAGLYFSVPTYVPLTHNFCRSFILGGPPISQYHYEGGLRVALWLAIIQNWCEIDSRSREGCRRRDAATAGLYDLYVSSWGHPAESPSFQRSLSSSQTPLEKNNGIPMAEKNAVFHLIVTFR